MVHQLETQLTQLREEHCSVLQSLKEAHQLIDKHVITITIAMTHEVHICLVCQGYKFNLYSRPA